MIKDCKILVAWFEKIKPPCASYLRATVRVSLGFQRTVSFLRAVLLSLEQTASLSRTLSDTE